MTNQQSGTIGGNPNQQGQQAVVPHFILTEEDRTELQRYRASDAPSPAHGDNATVILLVGQAGWNAQQIESCLGISQQATQAACRAWTVGGIRQLGGMSPASYSTLNYRRRESAAPATTMA